MRGKAGMIKYSDVIHRITPAYAGKSAELSTGRSGRLGSPPPMRGKAFLVCQCDYSTGITPAYAGKSFSRAATDT